MNIPEHLAKFLIQKDVCIKEAISRMDDIHPKVLIVCDGNKLFGSLTDGDIRRAIKKSGTSLEIVVGSAANKDCKKGDYNCRQYITAENEDVDLLPLVDSDNTIRGAICKHPKTLTFSKTKVGTSSPCYFIAEIGNNHNGDINRAKELIIAAKDAGANCVKFQTRNMKGLFREEVLEGSPIDLGSEYLLDLLDKYNLEIEQQEELFEFANNLGMDVSTTAWDIESARYIRNFSFPFLKVASADLTNLRLLVELCKADKPLIISTGMSTEEDIIRTINFLRTQGAEFIVLHCNSTYPTPFQDINLKYLSRLKELHPIIGYSGHERGIEVSIAAAALGAKVIERHITVDKSLEGPDHLVSLLPNEFKELVKSVRNVESALGSAKTRLVTQGEFSNKISLSKSLCAAKDLSKGTILNKENIVYLSPGDGIPLNQEHRLLGRQLQRDISAGKKLSFDDISQEDERRKSFNFPIAWGVPVRYHDAELILRGIENNLVEYHLSYRDLNLEPTNLITNFKEIISDHGKLVVHAPELFENGFILDLASTDENIRAKSIQHLSRVNKVALRLRELHNSKDVAIVVNCGGFSKNDFIASDEKKVLYENVNRSLLEVFNSTEQSVPAIQTMPPFPWHFGGQRFHNLFVDPEEIKGFCEDYGWRLCYDLSHTSLACNYLKESLTNASALIMPYSIHLHISDAAGAGGEGLQIGDGEIDFLSLFELINKYKNTIKYGFVPEIWQGHQNNGAGFFEALSRMEGMQKETI